LQEHNFVYSQRHEEGGDPLGAGHHDTREQSGAEGDDGVSDDQSDKEDNEESKKRLAAQALHKRLMDQMAQIQAQLERASREAQPLARAAPALKKDKMKRSSASEKTDGKLKVARKDEESQFQPGAAAGLDDDLSADEVRLVDTAVASLVNLRACIPIFQHNEPPMTQGAQIQSARAVTERVRSPAAAPLPTAVVSSMKGSQSLK
jgi:hypothetical protein